MADIYGSALAEAICEFIQERRALGYAYHKQAASLKRFDTFCVRVGCKEMRLSKDLAMKWAEKMPFESDDARGRRIRLVRMLAKYMARSGYDAYIYPDYLGASRSSAYEPYLFTEKELAGFFTQADRCLPLTTSPHRHLILPLLYRMLYGCGLRISEALNLTVRDVDPEKRILTIRNGKFHKDRLVPMSPSLADRCRAYMDTIHAVSQPEDVFFPSTHGGRYSARRIYDYFRRFLWGAGISHGGRGKGPRLHDVRHNSKSRIIPSDIVNRSAKSCHLR